MSNTQDKTNIKNHISKHMLQNDIGDIDRAYKYRDILFDFSVVTQFTITLSTAGIMISNLINASQTSSGKSPRYTMFVSGLFILSSGLGSFINHTDKQFQQQQVNILKKYNMYNSKYIDQNIEPYDTKEQMKNLSIKKT